MIAYFVLELGLEDNMPIYSGGLVENGVIAQAIYLALRAVS